MMIKSSGHLLTLRRKSIMSQLEGPVLLAPDGTEKLVVLLHGYGANGDDLMDLGRAWRKALPKADFISPHAPELCELSPGGRQWFSLQDRSPDLILSGLRCATPPLHAFIQQELRIRNLTEKDLALVGFSQGCMLALYAGLHMEQNPACILGYSGVFFFEEKALPRSRSKVMLIHGDLDDVVPYHALEASQKSLRMLGIDVQTHTSVGLRHGIDADGLALGASFLTKCLYDQDISTNQEREKTHGAS